jgi:periplasmic divalent cation tolerance protein
MTDKIVVLSTCASADEAEQIGRSLLEQRLAACISVVPGVRSIYHWKGAVESSDECLLLIKTSRELFGSVSTQLQKLHSYELPEVLALPVLDGSVNYLEWMGKHLGAA